MPDATAAPPHPEVDKRPSAIAGRSATASSRMGSRVSSLNNCCDLTLGACPVRKAQRVIKKSKETSQPVDDDPPLQDSGGIFPESSNHRAPTPHSLVRSHRETRPMVGRS